MKQEQSELQSQTQLVRELFNGVNGRLDEINDHLKELNGKVAKHSSWIERYDIRVGEEVPRHIDETKKSLDNINIKMAKWSGIIFGGMVVIEFLFKNFLK